jgi:hypothetical protein
LERSKTGICLLDGSCILIEVSLLITSPVMKGKQIGLKISGPLLCTTSDILAIYSPQPVRRLYVCFQSDHLPLWATGGSDPLTFKGSRAERRTPSQPLVRTWCRADRPTDFRSCPQLGWKPRMVTSIRTYTHDIPTGWSRPTREGTKDVFHNQAVQRSGKSPLKRPNFVDTRWNLVHCGSLA